MNFIQKSGSAKTLKEINLREGKPSTLCNPRKVLAGTILEFIGWIMDGESVSGNSKWFKTAEGNYFWSGNVEILPEVATAPVSTASTKWHTPIRADKFNVTQRFLTPDAVNYPKTKHHPGTDYGTQGEDNVPLYFCADGEVIENGSNHKFFGNYFFYYVPAVDRTFAYFHLRDSVPAKGTYSAGQQCGITGKTGLSYGIHLHLECIKGRKTSTDRANLFTSKDALAQAAEDADLVIRPRIQ